MKILRLRAYCYPEVVASSAMTEDIDEAFAKNNIISIDYTPIPTRGVTSQVRKEYKNKKYEELKDGHVIVHRFSMFNEGTKGLQRTLRFFLCALAEYFKGIKEKDIDVVYCGSTPPIQGLFCGFVAKKLSKKYGKKVPFIYNLQDIFPESLVNAGLTKQGSVIWKIGKKIEECTYKNADKIIVISEAFKRNIMGKGVSEEKIVIIPNWADTKGVYPVDRDKNILFDRYNLAREKFYISYVGTIGYMHNMELLLDTAKEIKNELPNVCFVIIGDGVGKTDVARRIKEENINNVILLPFQPYENIASAFSLGDVGLVICKPGVGRSGVPSKTWNIMAAEKPILASFDKDSELSSLIEGIGCGITADAGSKEELKTAIKQLASDPCLSDKGMLGKKYLLTELDKDKCVNKYIETFMSVL